MEFFSFCHLNIDFLRFSNFIAYSPVYQLDPSPLDKVTKLRYETISVTIFAMTWDLRIKPRF